MRERSEMNVRCNDWLCLIALEKNMAKKMCEICEEKPATVPDRERQSPIKRVCSSCHALRLAGDMQRIMELHEKRRAKSTGRITTKLRGRAALRPVPLERLVRQLQLQRK